MSGCALKECLLIDRSVFDIHYLCFFFLSNPSSSLLSYLDMDQSGLPVAVKQILLKNIPGKLTNIRQKEITILKVSCEPGLPLCVCALMNVV